MNSFFVSVSCRRKLFLLVLVTVLFVISCRKPEPFPEEDYDERLSGGSNTVFDNSSQAYSHELPGLSVRDQQVHETDDAAFEQTFITAPAPVNNGLGPAFNNVSCRSCHHNDGSGSPTTGGVNSALLVRISLPGAGLFNEAIPVPGYGTQLQDRAIAGKKPECKVLITYTDSSGVFLDGNRLPFISRFIHWVICMNPSMETSCFHPVWLLLCLVLASSKLSRKKHCGNWLMNSIPMQMAFQEN